MRPSGKIENPEIVSVFAEVCSQLRAQGEALRVNDQTIPDYRVLGNFFVRGTPNFVDLGKIVDVEGIPLPTAMVTYRHAIDELKTLGGLDAEGGERFIRDCAASLTI